MVVSERASKLLTCLGMAVGSDMRRPERHFQPLTKPLNENSLTRAADVPKAFPELNRMIEFELCGPVSLHPSQSKFEKQCLL